MAKKSSSPLDLIAKILLVVGGLNWGLIGLLNLNLIDTLFASVDIVARVIYILVGLSALYGIVMMTKQ